jgi:hypothetical protein
MTRRARPHRTNVPKGKPKSIKRNALPPRVEHPPPPPRREYPKLATSTQRARPPKRQIAQIIDSGERSLVDVLDSLLNQGVVLNADLILALADVDLVYVRLSALLCAADRVMKPRR